MTQINPQFDRYVMGKRRVISWQGANGNTLRGALLLPAGYEEGKRYPLIVYQYPPALMSDYANNFGLGRFSGAMENWQLLATRGYAVLLADVPTYPGTGKQMEEIAAAVLPGVDRAVELGIADSKRLGVVGHSAGGFGVLSLIVQTNKFAAAVDLSGPSDKLTVYGQLAPNGSSTYTSQIEQVLGGTPWEKRDRYVENSPVFYLDRVTTPLLIIHGTSDPFVPSVSSDAVFVGLRRLGKEVVYAKYKGEGHDPSHWSHANQVDYLNRMIAWFDKYLKAPEKREGSKQ
jgi:dipeptidyl aminopeptidase/acylaminoacyl peptidase